MKPHHGDIYGWRKLPYRGLTSSYNVAGLFKGHPTYDGKYGFTSLVLSHDEATGEIETKNSCYTLVGASL